MSGEAAWWGDDEVMGALVRRVGAYGLKRTRGGWEALACAVVYQQVSGKAAAGFCRRMSVMAGGSFPSPSMVVQEGAAKWLACGITGRKAETLVLLANAVVRGRLDLGVLAEKDPRLVKSVLTSFKGVGPWTAQMWLVFHANAQDEFMPGDVGLRKALRSEYGPALARVLGHTDVPSPVEAEAFASRWRGHRTMASWYLWRSDPKFPEPGFGEAGVSVVT